MSERVNRQTDENLYQPKIHSDRIKSLYQIKELTGIPMTVLVDLAIRELVATYSIDLQSESRIEAVDQEPMKEDQISFYIQHVQTLSLEQCDEQKGNTD